MDDFEGCGYPMKKYDWKIRRHLEALGYYVVATNQDPTNMYFQVFDKVRKVDGQLQFWRFWNGTEEWVTDVDRANVWMHGFVTRGGCCEFFFGSNDHGQTVRFDTVEEAANLGLLFKEIKHTAELLWATKEEEHDCQNGKRERVRNRPRGKKSSAIAGSGTPDSTNGD